MTFRSLFSRATAVLLTATCASAAPVSHPAPAPAETFTVPAEFERQSAVWIGARADENGHPALPTIAKMVKALTPGVDVYPMVPNAAVQAQLDLLLRKSAVDMRRVHYWMSKSSPTRWLRDVGAIFLKSNRGRLKVIDFDFNCYGDCEVGSPRAKEKEGIDRQIAGILRLPVVRTSLVSEGGDREINGRGTLMAVEATEMQRNPQLTRTEIERDLLQLLGQKKMLWLKRGVAEDEDAEQGPVFGNIYAAGAGCHIDEMARFTGPRTIVLARVTRRERDSDPVLKLSYERLKENARILKSATDVDGHRFRVVRMPVADPMYEDLTLRPGDHALSFFRGSRPGERIRVLLPASYMNFFISNGVVLLPAYWRPGRPESTRRKDSVARDIVQGLFPDRRIVQIDAESLIHGGGGMHCATQQQPAV
jgi:agmatine deiminase